jgi:hypothetical protein
MAEGSAKAPVFEVEPFDTFSAEPLPEAQWLIEPLFERDSQVVLWGESGSGKSFVALSWAMHIATGTPWLGKYPVNRANVLYCVGEGDRGMRRRGRAGAIEYGFDGVKGFFFLPVAPRIRDPKVLESFLKAVKHVMPGLVIIDTLARSFSGDENSAEHMNDWLNAATIIQRETGACVMVLHHTAKNVKKGGTATERGSGALRGAMDTSIQVRGGECVTLTCIKQKDDKQFEPIALQLKEVILREGEESRKPLTSAVIVPIDETIPTYILPPGASSPEIALSMLDCPMTTDEWRAVVKIEGRTPPPATFYRWANKLESECLIEKDEETGKWKRLV